MAIIDLFSKRQKRLRGEAPDVYVYDTLPQPLRVQLVYIIRDGVGVEGYHGHEQELHSSVHQTLCREYGVLSLSKGRHGSEWDAVADYLLTADNVEHVIDIAEIYLRLVDTEVRDNPRQYSERRSSPDDVITEFNGRCREHGVGFEYISHEIIRIDSLLVHDDVVKPALAFLSGLKYAGANDEFLRAHEHYRHGRYKESLAECLKSFESVMKIICDSKGWIYSATDTAKALINICIENGLFSSFLQSHISNLRVILESGVPTVRNKLSGHGQGSSVIIVSEATTRFALHVTAANILLLIESA